MDMNKTSGSTTTAGFVPSAGAGLKNDVLLNDLYRVAIGLTMQGDTYRQSVVDRAINELNVCYRTIATLDVLVQQLEKENEAEAV